jgi:hypothetical protein
MMGVKTGLNEAFIVDEKTYTEIIKKEPTSKNFFVRYLGGRNLDRYSYKWEKQYLIYIPRNCDLENNPYLLNHFSNFKTELEKRATKQNWYELQQSQEKYSDQIRSKKIIFPDISRYPKFSLDSDGIFFSNTVYFIASDSLYLLGLLNSKLIWFIIKGFALALRGGLWRYRLFSGYIERIPIRTIDFKNKSDVAKHDEIVRLVEDMLKLNKELNAEKSENRKETIQTQIADRDEKIDNLVYELYGLTPEEIKIVEGK